MNRLMTIGEVTRGKRRSAAAYYVGVSETKFDQWVDQGRMPRPKKIDGIVLWDVRELDMAFDAIMETGNPWDGK